MKVLIGVLALLSVVFGVFAGTRIVGGKPALIQNFPYQVSIRQKGVHLCGGSILSNNAILTAAHCNLGPINELRVWVNTSSLQAGGFVHDIAKFINHPYYNEDTLENDVAVIRLKTNINLTAKGPKAIALASYNTTVGLAVNASGWGYTSYPGSTPMNLQWIQLKTISWSDCRKNHTGYLFDGQICTLTKKGEGVCTGDSGSPLVAKNEVHGIASTAYLCALGMPDFFTRVYYYRDWIKYNAGI